jgi:hypothetical protein
MELNEARKRVAKRWWSTYGFSLLPTMGVAAMAVFTIMMMAVLTVQLMGEVPTGGLFFSMGVLGSWMIFDILRIWEEEVMLEMYSDVMPAVITRIPPEKA